MGVVRKLGKELKLEKCVPLRVYIAGWSFAFFVSIGVLSIGIIQKMSKDIPEDQPEKKIALVLTIIGSILLIISGWRLFVLVGKYFNLCPEMFFGELALRLVLD